MSEYNFVHNKNFPINATRDCIAGGKSSINAIFKWLNDITTWIF